MQLAPTDPATPAASNPSPEPAAPDAARADTRAAGDDIALHIGGMRVPLHVNARGLSLGILATIAFVFALQWAQKFFVPLLLGILIAYTLNPVVRWLERWHVKRIIGATLVTAVIVGAMAGTLYRLQGEFFNILDELPTLTHKVTRILTNTSGQRSTLQQMQAAAAEIERAASNVGADAKRLAQQRRQYPPPAAAASSPIRVMDWVLAGSMSP
ncbi:MAG TPA: AI-2E family transporter, partial [Massilia timonae]|nr:AI-2E family transporter [Massilia timonae]